MLPLFIVQSLARVTDKAENDAWRCVLPGELRHRPAAWRTPGGAEAKTQVK